MKQIPAFLLLAVLISCNPTAPGGSSNDTAASVKVIPKDSIDPNMPVKPMDTAASDMPIVNPDTSVSPL